MSAGQGSEHGWWQASDGNWYPPDQHPDPHHRARFAAPPPRAEARTAGPGTARIGAPAVLAVLAAAVILVAAMVAIVVSGGGDEAEQVVDREPTEGAEDAGPSPEADASPSEPTDPEDEASPAPESEAEPPGSDEPAFTWAVTGADGPTMEAVADLWNEENPDQRVDLNFLPPAPDDQRTQLFNDQVTGAGEFAEAGYIESLEDLRDSVEGVSIPGAIESAQHEGELYALPYATNFGFLYYRTDLVDEPPETWEELYDTVLEIQEDDPDIDGYVAQGDRYEGFVLNYLELLWSDGGEVFDDAATESLLLDGDHAERAITFMQDAFEEGVLASGFRTMTEDDARLAFQDGDAIFMRNWPYAYPLLQGEDDEDTEVAGDVGIAPLPTFEGAPVETVSTLGGINNAVSTLSDNPEVAREFVEWAATDEGAQEILAEMQPPPTKASIYQRHQAIVPEDQQPIYEVLNQVRQHARARPPVPGYNGFSLAVQEHLHSVYADGADPGPALEAVNEAAEEALVEDPEEDNEEEADMDRG